MSLGINWRGVQTYVSVFLHAKGYPKGDVEHRTLWVDQAKKRDACALQHPSYVCATTRGACGACTVVVHALWRCSFCLINILAQPGMVSLEIHKNVVSSMLVPPPQAKASPASMVVVTALLQAEVVQISRESPKGCLLLPNTQHMSGAYHSHYNVYIH